MTNFNILELQCKMKNELILQLYFYVIFYPCIHRKMYRIFVKRLVQKYDIKFRLVVT